MRDSDESTFRISMTADNITASFCGFTRGQYLQYNKLTHAREDRACAERITHVKKSEEGIFLSRRSNYMLLYCMCWPRVNPHTFPSLFQFYSFQE
ncbi:hypothetical protein AVEN_74680-1 [Araneus ventricosus]|uniref:Uncharacterized protein n=1 Tax=Araneus ventricosus TaxID=182803 RepID=A0A4Y2WGK8_ARAVE|nr:hypothetical protein AVEN_74680-1 [Araneus ventricosus]